ncbi:MFS transporter [Arthrobacter sp.]|uniref:MFS transporter n=1 Tax=Arthrobacter sp. TaxID=1667 RepID=UPI0033921402
MTAATISARLERLPVGPWHRKLVAVIGIGAFYEYFEVFLGGVLAAVLKPVWQLDTFQTASLIGSVFLGMFIGAMTLSRLADIVGRKRMFVVNLSIYLGFSLLAAFSPNVEFLIICRILAGIGAGAEAALIPTYLAEFIPRKLRGRYIGYAFTTAFLAYPAVALIGAPLAKAFFLFEGWRWLMVIAASGIVLILWIRRSLPESPRWLLSVGRYEAAEREMQSIERQVEKSAGPLPELDVSSIDLEANHIVEAKKVSILELFRGQNARRMIAVGSLWTLGVLAYYGFSSLAPMLLISKGFNITQSLLYTSAIAVGYPLGALCCALVAERFERRTLTVVSGLVTAAAGMVCGFTDSTAIILVSGFIIGFVSNIYSTSTNMYASEVFPTRLRSTAIGVCYGSGRLFALALPFLGLPVLTAFGGSGVLIGSAVLYVVTAILVLLFGPKTTGRTLEDAAEDTAENVAAAVLVK